MSLTVCTAHVSALTRSHPWRLDITWKGAKNEPGNRGAIFAPAQKLFFAAWHGEIDGPTYHAKYHAQLDRTLELDPTLLIRFADGIERVVGFCYCEDATVCHRTVWRKWMIAHGCIDGGEYGASTMPDPRQLSLF
jgi:hypothetical protein